MNEQYITIINKIKNKKYDNVYFLQGEEIFFIDEITNLIADKVLDESQKTFNQMIFYGRDISLVDVVGNARKYPMGSEKQVIIIKEAQEIKDWKNNISQSLLIEYLQKPLKSTLLVFAYKYKTLDARTKIIKELKKCSVFLNAKKIYDDKIPLWITQYCKDNNVTIDRHAVMILSENVGNNLKRLSNEIKKLLLNHEKGSIITAESIQKYVGISKEYSIFELQKSIGKRNIIKSLRIINYFAANPTSNPIVLIIYGLFTYFTKLLYIHHSKTTDIQQVAKLIGVHPFFVEEYLTATHNYSLSKIISNIKFIHETDLQSKGIGYVTKKDESILTELVYKLIH